MSTYDEGGLFSLSARRDLVARRAKERQGAQAHAKRVLARLTSERRVREILDLIASAERRVLGRLAFRDFPSFLAQAKSAIARLGQDDRSAALEAAEVVARSLEAASSELDARAKLQPAKHGNGANGIGTREARE